MRLLEGSICCGELAMIKATEMLFCLIFTLIVALCSSQDSICGHRFPKGLYFGEGAAEKCLDGTDEDKCNTSTMSHNVTEQFQLNEVYTFFGQPYHSACICENVLISFGDCRDCCNNKTGLRNSSLPLIIGLWEDIELRKFGTFPFAYYSERMKNNSKMNCFNENQEKVMEHLERGFGTLSGFNATHIFVSTWYGLEYGTSGVQIVVATEECKQDTYALLIYKDMNITEDDRIQIGFSAGSSNKYYPLSKSATGSNIGVPGVYVFRIDEDDIIDPNPVDCGDLPQPANGEVVYTSTSVDSVATYTCSFDCSTTIRVCMENGSWSDEEPKCPSNCSCEDPHSPQNGWVSISYDGPTGLVATYGCDEGYEMSPANNTRRTCNCHGQWSGEPPQCNAAIKIRLVDRKRESSGKVEVYHKNEWSSVCDDKWTDEDADVVCRQLGFLPYGAIATRKWMFKEGEPISYCLDDVECKGNESSLFACKHRETGTHNCRQGERAGVDCLTENDVAISLLPSTINNMCHTIEISIRGKCGSVCNKHWTNDDARIVCRQLGYNYTNAEVCDPKEEQKMGYGMDFVNCGGDEESLLACDHIWREQRCSKAGVMCQGKKPDAE